MQNSLEKNQMKETPLHYPNRPNTQIVQIACSEEHQPKNYLRYPKLLALVVDSQLATLVSAFSAGEE